MKPHRESIELKTSGRALVEITGEVAEVVARSGVREGVCTVFCPHTSAGLLLNENADPDVKRDLLAWFERAAPDGDPRYAHDAEGPDDMAAHIRTAISRASETVPVAAGRLALGTWQGIYFAEHRTSPHRRRVVVTVLGE